LERRRACDVLSSSNGSDKIFNCAMIFHARCLLNTAANINGVRRDRFDCATDILRI
jgi:hypothetical protein